MKNMREKGKVQDMEAGGGINRKIKVVTGQKYINININIKNKIINKYNK